jgi:hypothetical protein
MNKQVRVYHAPDTPVSRNIGIHIWNSIAFDLKIICLWIILVVLTLVIPVISASPLRFIAVIPLFIIIPGYSLVGALYPGNKPISSVRRVLLSIGISVGLLCLMVVFLVYRQWGIQLNFLIIADIILTALMGPVILYRRFRVPESERYHPSFMDITDDLSNRQFFTAIKAKNRLLLLVLSVLLLVFLFVPIFYVMENPKLAENIPGLSQKSGDIPQSGRTPIVESITRPLPSRTTIPPAIIPVSTKIPAGIQQGMLIVSVGNYSSGIPVFIDGTNAGTASPGKPLGTIMEEGSHDVKVCGGEKCRQVNVYIGYAIQTTVDFEEFLEDDVPQGSLGISAGDYPATLPVFIDGSVVGNVSQGTTINRTMNAGNHTVKICYGEICFNKIAEIQPSNLTSIDFEEQLENDLPQGSVHISIGGYPGDKLPVFVDSAPVGNVSLGKPLDIRVNVGNHNVSVCVGYYCEHEDMQIKFGTPIFIDFGERLKKDVEFSKPTIRIVNSSLTDNTLTVSVEFNNPDSSDHVMTATVSCVYSFLDSQKIRRSDSAQEPVTIAEKAGGRETQQMTLWLGGGTSVMANAPVITEVTVR